MSKQLAFLGLGLKAGNLLYSLCMLVKNGECFNLVLELGGVAGMDGNRGSVDVQLPDHRAPSPQLRLPLVVLPCCQKEPNILYYTIYHIKLWGVRCRA